MARQGKAFLFNFLLLLFFYPFLLVETLNAEVVDVVEDEHRAVVRTQMQINLLASAVGFAAWQVAG